MRVGKGPVSSTAVNAAASARVAGTPAAAESPTTTAITTAGNEHLSATASRTDSALFEHKKCYTGGQQQQQQQQQYRHNNSNGEANVNNWPNHFNNNNNWINCSPNQKNYPDNSREFHYNQINNNWQRKNNWNNSRDTFRQDAYTTNQHQSRRPDHQERTDYHRNSSANRSGYNPESTVNRTDLQSKRNSNVNNKCMNDKRRDKHIETQNKTNETKQKSEQNTKIKEQEKKLKTTKKDITSISKSPTLISKQIHKETGIKQTNSDHTKKIEPRSIVKNKQDDKNKAENSKNKLQTIKSSNEGGESASLENTKKESKDKTNEPSKRVVKNKEKLKSIKTCKVLLVKSSVNFEISEKSIRKQSQSIQNIERRDAESIEKAKVQSESPNTEKPLEVEKETNVQNTLPIIQVRPLTELLRQEILAVTQEHLLADSSPSISTPPRSAQIRRRTISNGYINNTDNGDLSINDRLANMDKESLKYIINNSDTIFNEHLKSQARRRLREEIRRQLKEIELDEPKDQPANLVEDVIVDAIKLPHLLLQEIEKCFGVDIVVPNVERTSNVQEELEQSTKETSSVAIKSEERVTDISEENQSIEESQENHTQTTSSNDYESDETIAENARETSNRAPNIAESELSCIGCVKSQSCDESETCEQEIHVGISSLNPSLSKNEISCIVDVETTQEDAAAITDIEVSIDDAESKQLKIKCARETLNKGKISKKNDQTEYTDAKSSLATVENEKTIGGSGFEIESYNTDDSTETMSKEDGGGSSDLMSRLKVAEQFKALTAKRSNKSPTERVSISSSNSNQGEKTSSEPKPLTKRRKKAKRLTVRKFERCKKQAQQRNSPKIALTDERVNAIMPSSTIKIKIKTESSRSPEISLIVLSSSEDDEIEELTTPNEIPANTESVVDLDDDAASNHSGLSNSSSETSKRRSLKLHCDADNVVDSFEKLILPQLKDSLAQRYRSSHCTNLLARLHFISCVVTSSEYNSQTFSKIQVAKMQQNLKSADNRLAIDFLLREIVNVLNTQKQTALARRKQQTEKEQSATNELNTTAPLIKNAELASVVAHQSICSNGIAEAAAAAAETARTLMPPTPPRNGTPTPASVENPIRSLAALPLGIPQVCLPSLSPSSYTLPRGDPKSVTGDMVLQHLLEIDRRLVENQSRRGFLDEMIMKFQKEKSDLEALNLELQSRKLLLLSSAISKQAAASPPIATSGSATLETNTVSKSKQRTRRAVIVKRVKILPKRRPPAKRLRAAETTQDEATKSEEENAVLAIQPGEQLQNSSPDPLDLQLQIKEEPILVSEISPKAVNKRVKNQPTTVGSPKRQRLSRTTSMNANQQPLAVIPPLPPPPPPPEPFASLSYGDSMSTPSTPSSAGEDPLSLNMANFNYGYVPSGRMNGITSPITQIRIYKLYIIAASENGDVYMFNIGTHKLELQITKHSEAITNMFLCEKNGYLYTTSLDGFLKKSSLENLERVMQTVYLKEPLQSIDVAWGIAFVGSRWGNVFTYNIASNKVMDMPLLSTGQSIISIKVTKEGVRKIILLGCKGNSVFLHDAATGLLLRRLAVPDGLNVYSLLLTDGHVYCGTQKNEVFKVDFASGALTRTLRCGNGAVAMAIFGEKYLLIGCYDGFIYVLNKDNGMQLGRFNGPGRLVLALAIAGDKVVASSKDNSLEILEIPAELLNVNKSR